jgi:hypothetical protein
LTDYRTGSFGCVINSEFRDNPVNIAILAVQSRSIFADRAFAGGGLDHPPGSKGGVADHVIVIVSWGIQLRSGRS